MLQNGDNGKERERENDVIFLIAQKHGKPKIFFNTKFMELNT
jgi:hypothetical protein